MNLTNIVNNLEKSYLDFKLGEEQRNVLLSIFNFIQSKKEKVCTLNGFAGSGKSNLTKLITRYLEYKNIPYVLATPTHKAKGVLAAYTERDVTTLHKLLTLRPTIDIMELDFKDLKFSSTTLDSGIPYNGVLIVDECSMVNKALYDFIIKKTFDRNCKTIFVGDECQICPVKEGKLSETFNINNVFTLSKVYRQKDNNPILDILDELRKNAKLKFNEIRSENGSLYLYNNWQLFINSNIIKFKTAVKERDPALVKLIAYTNKRVEAFNNIIRYKIFNNNNEYNIGDILTGYDSCEYKKLPSDILGYTIINSSDYIVENITKTEKYIGLFNLIGYVLTIYSVEEEVSFPVFILSKSNKVSVINELAKYIESIRLEAVNCKISSTKNRIWREYFKLMTSFLTPFDLIYDNRVVRKKSLDYGYCITDHKSQGSSYNTILVDMDNIFTCKKLDELRQLQYVALSRTKKDIHMLIK